MRVKSFLVSKGSITAASIVVLSLMVFLYNYSLEPKHVEFEPYKSPQETDQRLRQLELETQKDPHNVSLQLEFAHLLIEKRKANNIVDEFIELGQGPGSVRLDENYQLWKRTDSVLSRLLTADSSNTRALELRLTNFRVNGAGERNGFPMKWREPATYCDETIPNTILSLLRINPHLVGEYRTFPSMADTFGVERQKEYLGRYLSERWALADLLIEHIRRDSPYSGEAWGMLSSDNQTNPEAKKLSGLRSIRYGVNDRWNFLTNPYLYKSEFELMKFFEHYRREWGPRVTKERLGQFPGIAQFIFFHDISRFVVPDLSIKEWREYIIKDLIRLIGEYPKLAGLYNLLIYQYIKNKENDSALQWIHTAAKEIPYFSLTNHHYYVYSMDEIAALLARDPTNPVLRLDSLNVALNIYLTENRATNFRRKGAIPRFFADNIEGKSKETLLTYLEGLKSLESDQDHYWGYLENKVRTLEALLIQNDVGGEEYLQDLESSVFMLLRRYRECGYFPKINFTLPMYFVMHGMEMRGRILLQKLIDSAPELAIEFLRGGAPDIDRKKSLDGFLEMTAGLSVGDQYSQSALDVERANAFLFLKQYNRAISLLEKVADQDYFTISILISAYEGASQYAGAMEACNMLEQYESKYNVSYARATKASCLRKLGNQRESDSLFFVLEKNFPDRDGVYLQHAQCLFEMKEYKDALKVIESGIKNGSYDRYLNQLKDSVLVKMKM